MKKLLLAAVAALTTPVHAGGCDEETIRGVTRGGSVAVLESATVYEVEPDNIPDRVLCNAGDGVLVCGDAITPIGVWSRRPVRTLRRGGRIPPESRG